MGKVGIVLLGLFVGILILVAGFVTDAELINPDLAIYGTMASILMAFVMYLAGRIDEMTKGG